MCALGKSQKLFKPLSIEDSDGSFLKGVGVKINKLISMKVLE